MYRPSGSTRFIKSLADIGLSCLFISSEQEEIVGMCHRVLVMKEGRIMGVLAGDAISEADHVPGDRRPTRRKPFTHSGVRV